MNLRVLGRNEHFQVVHGEEVFRLFDTSGLPLDIVFLELKDRGYMPDWKTFYSAAEKSWSHKTIISRLREALPVYNHVSDFTETVIKRLDEVSRR